MSKPNVIPANIPLYVRLKREDTIDSTIDFKDQGSVFMDLNEAGEIIGVEILNPKEIVWGSKTIGIE